MKLDIRALAVAAGSVTAAIFAICAFFIAVAPEGTMAFFSYLLHIDLTGLRRAVSWGSFFGGLLATGLGAGLAGGAAAWLYNRLV